ncbi:hypothetical protein B0A55_13182 [Friedmanniomyces simplex]|uniref:Inner membrane assembly complex subunit 17 n=1 Tax=Friedmanniomyces simplex TaxID=329884 RepID=A0A4U0V994_9PEZI|nr:hypothetical protein B0A55_13182 [Friedmanniomyces simplex]
MPPLLTALPRLSSRLPTRLLTPTPLPLHRLQSTYQPPDPPLSQQQQQPSHDNSNNNNNPHGNFYKTFGRPLAKTFLIAVATYQLLYISWLKLESMEVKREKEGEMRALRGELEGLTAGTGTGKGKGFSGS